MSSILLIEYNHPLRKNVYRCGDFRVTPGINEVPKVVWNGHGKTPGVKDNPTVKAMLADEYLKVLCEKGEKVAKPKGKDEPPAPTEVIGDFSVKDAAELVDKCNDVNLLLKWRDEEKSNKQRRGVLKAIDEKLANIEAQVVKDEDEDEDGD